MELAATAFGFCETAAAFCPLPHHYGLCRFCRSHFSRHLCHARLQFACFSSHFPAFPLAFCGWRAANLSRSLNVPNRNLKSTGSCHSCRMHRYPFSVCVCVFQTELPRHILFDFSRKEFQLAFAFDESKTGKYAATIVAEKFFKLKFN